MIRAKKKQIFEQFASFITPQRRALFERISAERTRYVCAVLEDVYQEHNISAVLRSAECFGIQDVHIIEDRNSYKVQEEIAKGSAQWLSIHRYNVKEGMSRAECFSALRSNGYKIVATTPHEQDMLISSLPLNQKIALIFGTEQQGLSEYALENADMFVKVPMFGFTESFNISVCAGIMFYEIVKRLRNSATVWQLSEEERLDVLLDWLSRSTNRGEQIMALLKEHNL